MATLFRNPFASGNAMQSYFGGGSFVGQNYNFSGNMPTWQYQGANFMNEFVNSNIGKASTTGFMASGPIGSGKAPAFGFEEMAPTSGPGSSANLDYATFSEAEAPAAYGSDTESFMSDLGRNPNPFYTLSGLSDASSDRAAADRASSLRKDISTYCAIKNKDKALASLSALLDTASGIGDSSLHDSAMKQVQSATQEVQDAFPGPGIGDDIAKALPQLAMSAGELVDALGLLKKKGSSGNNALLLGNRGKSDNTMLYVGLGVAALAAVGLGFMFLKKGKPV